MIKKILPLLNRLIPSNLAKKGLEKTIPQLSQYFAGAAAAGYALEDSLDFLRNEFEGKSQNLRPDELAAETRVKQAQALPEALETATNLGIGTAGAAAIPTVIGNLFQNQPSNASPPAITEDMQRQIALENNLKKAKKRRGENELSIDALQKQFQENQQSQGKAALLQTMQEINETLRKLKGE